MALKKIDLKKNQNLIRIQNTGATDIYISRINPHDEVFDGFEIAVLLDLSDGSTGALGMTMIGETGGVFDTNSNIRLNFAFSGVVQATTPAVNSQENIIWGSNPARYIVANDSGTSFFEEYQIISYFIWDAKKQLWLETRRSANLRS